MTSKKKIELNQVVNFKVRQGVTSIHYRMITVAIYTNKS